MEILIVFENYSSRYSPLLQAFEVRRNQFFSFFFYIRDFIFICNFLYLYKRLSNFRYFFATSCDCPGRTRV